MPLNAVAPQCVVLHAGCHGAGRSACNTLMRTAFKPPPTRPRRFDLLQPTICAFAGHAMVATITSGAAQRAVYSTSLLESVDAASVEVTPELAKAYERVQNGSDIRGVAISGALQADETQQNLAQGLWQACTEHPAQVICSVSVLEYTTVGRHTVLLGFSLLSDVCTRYNHESISVHIDPEDLHGCTQCLKSQM